MSFSSSLDAKELVRQAIDIVELVGRYIQLRRQGRGYVGHCPWHDDSRPSLQVNPERQSFKCWVCDIGGDVFSFIQKIEGVSFPEALAMLADRAGIELKPQRPVTPDSPEAIGKKTLLQAAAWAEKQYHECLLKAPEAEVARKYLVERGLTAESIERFQLGFSPLKGDWLLGRAERTPQRARILETIGILARGDHGVYDRFHGRVLFSIHDAQGRPVGLGGRVLPELGLNSPAKYVNSPETPLFTKSKLLYGLDLARDAIRKSGDALVMEGYTDVIVSHQYGFQNAVAVLGTALGSEHIRILKHYAKRVILVLDGDEAGQKRTKEVLGLFLSQNADLRVLTLPDDLDPCDFLHKFGAEAFAEMLKTRSIDALEHAFLAETRGLDVQRDVHGATEALERLVAMIAQAPRLRTDTTTDWRLREEKALQRAAAFFRIDEQDVRRRLTTLRRKSTGRGPAARVDQAESSQPAAPERLDPWRCELFELLVAHPEWWPTAREQIGDEWLAAGASRSIYEACCRMVDDGVLPDFDRLMLELDEPAAKSLLVELDERWHQKQERTIPPETLLHDMIKNIQNEEAKKRRPAQLVALREGQLDTDQGMAVLLKILEQEGSRQGIAKPKDG